MECGIKADRLSAIPTTDQDLPLQTKALTRAECEKLSTDEANGAKVNRPGMAKFSTRPAFV